MPRGPTGLSPGLESLAQGREALQAARDKSLAAEKAMPYQILGRELMALNDPLGRLALSAATASKALALVQPPYARPTKQQELYTRLTDPDKIGDPLDAFKRTFGDITGLQKTLAAEVTSRAAAGGGLIAAADKPLLPAGALPHEAFEAFEHLRHSVGLGDHGPRLADAAELGSREFARSEAVLANPNARGPDILSEMRVIEAVLKQTADYQRATYEMMLKLLPQMVGPPVVLGGGH